MTDQDRDETYREFRSVVNLSPSRLSEWLDTDRSKEVGQKSGDSAESVGHRSGRRIVRLLETDKSELTDADYEHMRKVIGYVHRHREQRPQGDVEDTTWRYSLMNWGHDPLA